MKKLFIIIVCMFHMTACNAEPSAYQELEQACSKITREDGTERKFQLIVGKLISGKSHTAAAPIHSGFSGYNYTLYIVTANGPVRVTQHLTKAALQDFSTVFSNRIGGEYINKFTGNITTEFNVGICASKNTKNRYSGRYKTIKRFRQND